jgi:acyl-coenzyme A synthetase/AMP-(fatty) acid ligase/3-hydroxymyristoyl/3-hydroxydecanoyl-(acyl carrier protein) dehydratase
MGLLFAGEFIIRKKTDKKMPKAFPLSKFKVDSRSPDTVLCYEGAWGEGVRKTWKDFLDDSAKLRRTIRETPGDTWLLHCEDCWYFLTAFTALLQCKKEILLTANISPGYIGEIRFSRSPGIPFLTDQIFSPGPGEEALANAIHIPSVLNEAPAEGWEEIPPIDADETSIVMYTSGSTGKPKAVLQRLTEFETDNRFILSKWGEEFLKRRLCSTVSQHHIYGLLFSILLPFTAGVPFRRKRIEFPEEFEKLTDTEYMIITVPAFLKRAVNLIPFKSNRNEVHAELESPGALGLKSPWIFTSGGVLTPETAKKTREVFGFWPVEVYGSTETIGIAWRQSKNGPEWTPFDNAQISLSEESCLIIRSPYIKDPAGFVTADMAEILDDGRFLLKGRIDSVVKIEEKRISLTEVESRILQSGLAADVCVVPMDERRQYLAAALVFNEAGKEKFKNREKREINRYFREYLLAFFENLVLPKRWRYLDALPLDPQGKKKRPEIQALFASPDGSVPDTIMGEVIREKSETSVSLEFAVPEDSPYFDGHFPHFKILPAAAQFDLAVKFAFRYLGTSVRVREIKRIKFSNIIRPGTLLMLNLSYNKDSSALHFKTTSPEGGTLYSSGSMILDAAPGGEAP